MIDPAPTEAVAPWINHHLLDAVVAAASAPVWNPSPEVTRFLWEMGIAPSVFGLVAWIRDVHRRVCASGVPPLSSGPANL